ncbi:MAG TPA: VanW family protein [Bacillota bacterium]
MDDKRYRWLLGAVFVFLVGAGFGVSRFWLSHQPQKNDKAKPRGPISRSIPLKSSGFPDPSPSDNTRSKPVPDGTVFDGADHPYGRPAKGVLRWENNRAFHEFCSKHHISLRMAAFQTTLPDPLPGEEFNVALAADLLAGTVVEPGRVFSMNGTIGPYTKDRGFQEGPAYFGTQVFKTIGGGVCKIATTLYNVTTLANLEIIERRPHGMPVPYVPPGQDATVSDGAKDFKFRNNTGQPLFIWADTHENTLFMAIYGRTKPPKVEWRHQILRRQKNRIIHRVNRELPPGTQRVVIPGADGLTVKSWLIITYPEGRVNRRDLGIDTYQPLPEVRESGR